MLPRWRLCGKHDRLKTFIPSLGGWFKFINIFIRLVIRKGRSDVCVPKNHLSSPSSWTVTAGGLPGWSISCLSATWPNSDLDILTNHVVCCICCGSITFWTIFTVRDCVESSRIPKCILAWWLTLSSLPTVILYSKSLPTEFLSNYRFMSHRSSIWLDVNYQRNQTSVR